MASDRCKGEPHRHHRTARAWNDRKTTLPIFSLLFYRFLSLPLSLSLSLSLSRFLSVRVIFTERFFETDAERGARVIARQSFFRGWGRAISNERWGLKESESERERESGVFGDDCRRRAAPWKLDICIRELAGGGNFPRLVFRQARGECLWLVIWGVILENRSGRERSVVKLYCNGNKFSVILLGSKKFTNYGKK